MPIPKWSGPTDRADDLRYDLYDLDAMVADVLIPWVHEAREEPMIAARFDEARALHRELVAGIAEPESDTERERLTEILDYLLVLDEAVRWWQADVAERR